MRVMRGRDWKRLHVGDDHGGIETLRAPRRKTGRDCLPSLQRSHCLSQSLRVTAMDEDTSIGRVELVRNMCTASQFLARALHGRPQKGIRIYKMSLLQ